MQSGHEHFLEAPSWHLICPPSPLCPPPPPWSLTWRGKPGIQQRPLPLSVLSGQSACPPVLGTQINPKFGIRERKHTKSVNSEQGSPEYSSKHKRGRRVKSTNHWQSHKGKEGQDELRRNGKSLHAANTNWPVKKVQLWHGKQHSRPTQPPNGSSCERVKSS